MNLQQAKALFFAQYLGQYRYRSYNYPNGGNYMINWLYLKDEYIEKGFLLLRSVNQLTDEEVIELAKLNKMNICLDPEKQIRRGKECIFFNSIGDELYLQFDDFDNSDIETDGDTVNNVRPLNYVTPDYLRSIGILLPFTYIDETGKPVNKSVEEIIALGWAKIN